ncbi:MAG: hypothetical protein AAF740_03485 [Bacteroidota bacterium]
MAGQINISISNGKTTSTVAAPSAAFFDNIAKQQKATLHVKEDAAGNQYMFQFKDFQNKVNKVVLKGREGDGGSKGIMYPGSKMFKIPASYYTEIGADPSMAKVLDFVSSNEGKYDAINSWDRAFFSFGFIQFAGGKRSLQSLLALIKYRDPFVFSDCFQRFGIDVEYTFGNNKFANPPQTQIVVKDPATKKVYKGDDAEKRLRDNKILTCAFVRAGHDPEVAKLQVLMAAYEYANPSLARNISVKTASGTPVKAPASAFITSPAGIATLVDLSVNKGVGGANKYYFTPAIQTIINRDKLNTPAEIKGINQRDVLLELINAAVARDNDRYGIVRKRVTKALQHFGG